MALMVYLLHQENEKKAKEALAKPAPVLMPASESAPVTAPAPVVVDAPPPTVAEEKADKEMPDQAAPPSLAVVDVRAEDERVVPAKEPVLEIDCGESVVCVC